MKCLLIFLFTCFNANGFASEKATVVALYDTSLGAKVYLERYALPGLEYERVDSVDVLPEKDVIFSFAPDSKRAYRLRRADAKWYFARFYPASGDSLIYTYYMRRPELIFDKIGANLAFTRQHVLPKSQWDFYHDMGDKEWTDLLSYVTHVRDVIDSASEAFSKEYPEHPGLAVHYRAQALRWYYEPQFRYFDDYYDSTKEAFDRAAITFKSFDSINWQSPLMEEHLENLLNEYVDKSMLRWQKMGRDTAGIGRGLTWYRKHFELAYSLPKHLREVAVLGAFSRLAYVTPTDAVVLGDECLAKMERVGTDPKYLQAYARTIDAIRLKLPGKLAPGFSLPDSNGRVHGLSDFRGKLVYLDFWGSWCQPCLQELPYLDTLESKFSQDSSVKFVSISLEGASQFEYWKTTLRKHGLGGLQLIAREQFNNPVAVDYSINAVPTFMLIAPDGTFINASAPRPSDPAAERAIREALKQLK